jgi:hypothetical protein
MEPPGSSETSVLTRVTRRNNPEDTILHSHRRENLKSYIEPVSLQRSNLVIHCAAIHLACYVAVGPARSNINNSAGGQEIQPDTPDRHSLCERTREA